MQILLEMNLVFGKQKVNYSQLKLLAKVHETGSLKAAAQIEQISYKNAWDKMRAMSDAVGFSVLESTSKKSGSRISAGGAQILQKFFEFQEFAANLDGDFCRKISAQNRLKAQILSIAQNGQKGWIKAQSPAGLIKAQISSASINELALAPGKNVQMLFKIYAMKYVKKCALSEGEQAAEAGAAGATGAAEAGVAGAAAGAGVATGNIAGAQEFASAQEENTLILRVLKCEKSLSECDEAAIYALSLSPHLASQPASTTATVATAATTATTATAADHTATAATAATAEQITLKAYAPEALPAGTICKFHVDPAQIIIML